MASAAEIAATQRARIHTGDLRPGDRLPSMRELMDAHHVSRQTARQALVILKDEGLAQFTGGRGGTVVRARPSAPLTRSAVMERDARGDYAGPDVQHWRAITAPQVEPAARVPDEIAAILGLEPGTSASVRRHLIGDPQIPEHRQLVDSWLHPAAVAALARARTRGGIHQRLESWAGAPLAWDEQSTAATPSPAESEALLLPPGVPLLRVIRRAVLRTPAPDGDPWVAALDDIRMSGELFCVRRPLGRGRSWP